MDNVRSLWLLTAAVVGGWLVYQLSDALTPFLLSALLAYMGDPLVDRLERIRVNRSAAVVIVLVGMVTSVVAVLVLVVPLISSQVGAFMERMPQYLGWLEERLGPVLTELRIYSPEGLDLEGAGRVMADHLSQAGGIAAQVVSWITASGARVIAVLINILLVPVVTFYLMRDWDDIVGGIRSMLPRDREPTISALAAESDRMLSGFLRGQLLVMVSLGTIYTIGLLILGIENAIALGVIAGLISFVPYMGSILGVLVAGLVAMVQTGDLLVLAGVALVFGSGQFIEGTFLTPRLVGDRIGVHPVLVIFAAMAGGSLFGFFGVLLALPAAAVIAVLLRHAIKRYRSSEFYHGGSGPDWGGDEEGGDA